MYSQRKNLILLLVSMLYVAGCGQKGPLYLPGNTNEVSTSIPRQQENAREDEDEDEEAQSRVDY